MVSIGALLVGSGKPCFSSNSQTRKSKSCWRVGGFHNSNAKRPNRKHTSLVKAISAPEKPGTDEPFTAWGTAIERVAKRTDLKTIMIIGAGPIVIGQVRSSHIESA